MGLIYKLDMGLICHSQKPVKARVLPMTGISCSFVNCAAMQTQLKSQYHPLSPKS